MSKHTVHMIAIHFTVPRRTLRASKESSAIHLVETCSTVGVAGRKGNANVPF
jgi:hypothetical protein